MSDDHCSTNRIALRKRLLDQKYRPLPLEDKGIRIKGWSTCEIDAAWVKKHSRSAKFTNTGIRCDDLLAFDIDVLDATLSDTIEAYVEATVGPTDLCRVGRWPKRLLLYRVRGALPTRSHRTGQYGGHMVELLCGRGRQFVAYGIHPGTGEPYEWLEDIDPLTVPYDDLPAITYAEAMSCLDGIESDIFEPSGLDRTRRGGSAGGGGNNEYDMTPEQPVELDGEVMPWSVAIEALDHNGCFGNLMREGGQFGDSGAVHFFISQGSNAPCAHDFVNDITHWSSIAAPEIADLLPTPGTKPGDTDLFTPPALQELQKKWVLMGDNTVINLEDIAQPLTLKGFTDYHAYLTVPDPNAPARAPHKTIAATLAWKKDPRTLRAHWAAFRPDCRGQRFIQRDSITLLNTYTAPVHESGGGSVNTVMRFLSHLIPCPVEREQFLDWHALKVARPWMRMHGLLTVTEASGTGRGTWLLILRALLGDEYIKGVPFSSVDGSTSQAQYNGFMSNCLITYVAEALEENRETTGKWRHRRMAYEAVKTFIGDMIPESIEIRRKYGRNSHEMVYASLLASSNHIDTLAITPDDRRLIVLDNTTIPLQQADGGLCEAIHTWRADPANIAALYRMLVARADSGLIKYDPMDAPMMTDAKRRMISSGMSEVDELFEYLIERAPGDIMTFSQWRALAKKKGRELDLQLPESDTYLDAQLSAVFKSRARRFLHIPRCGIKVAGVVVRPWIIRQFDRWAGVTDNSLIGAEILKNGDTGGAVLRFPK